METARIDFDAATAVTRQKSRPCIRASERRSKAITVPGILAELFSENDLGLQGLKMIFENVRFVASAFAKGVLSGVPMAGKDTLVKTDSLAPQAVSNAFYCHPLQCHSNQDGIYKFRFFYIPLFFKTFSIRFICLCLKKVSTSCRT